MNTKVLTTYIIGENKITLPEIPPYVEILQYKNEDDIQKAKGEYISFIDSEDTISDNYFSVILEQIMKKDFELCYLNYKINYNFTRELKSRVNFNDLENLIPKVNSYIWNYVFQKSKLLKIVKNKQDDNFDVMIKEEFKNIQLINDTVYFHNEKGTYRQVLNMTNRKKTVYYKNIIYIGRFCVGLFNGYITWLKQLGKLFPEFSITIVHTEITEITKESLSQYFNCIKYDSNINYLCDNLVTTYSTYFYPTNIYSLKENSMFIHGNMADYENAMHFCDDIYDRYIAVSKVARDKAIGYFPTENIEYIYNPYIYEPNSIKPHLKLISAIRNSPEKGINRIKKVAHILDEEKIPYTWSVFTDVIEENQGGLIFRNSITNVIDYVADCDYLVQFSVTEAWPYSVLEALSAGTKIMTTDIPAIHELNVIDSVNGTIIPMEYFDDGNEQLLKRKILEAYKNKDLRFDYNYEYDKFSDYQNVFSKNNKKLSIITPYYNTLKHTITLAYSLIPQLTDEVEWIIVDDGCNEKELDELNAKVIHLDKCTGNASIPRNIGIENASGEYIAFIDSDDYVYSNYVEKILEKIEEGFDYCYYSWDADNGAKVIIEEEPPEWNNCVWNCVYNRNIIGQNRFDPNINYGEDKYFNEVVRKGKRLNIKEIIYQYTNLRENSLTDLYIKGDITCQK